jgi:hypothetical protein
MNLIESSVADTGCLSRILIFSIPDPGSNSNKKEEGRKKFVVLPLFEAINLTKFEVILLLNRLRKKFESTDIKI